MTKELQDLAWSVFPKEFKEEVRKIYIADDPLVFPEENEIFDYIFGYHNLTSVAKGEEMLYCDKSVVQDMYRSAIRAIQIHDYEGNTIASQNMATFNRGIKFTIETLLGSKCLPDEPETNCHHLQDPKPVEPKDESPVIIDCDKCSEQGKCDRLIKRVLPAQKRLQIAAMAMQGLLASPVDANMQSKSVDYITDASFEYADALISKSKKGGLNESN